MQKKQKSKSSPRYPVCHASSSQRGGGWKRRAPRPRERSTEPRAPPHRADFSLWSRSSLLLLFLLLFYSRRRERPSVAPVYRYEIYLCKLPARHDFQNTTIFFSLQNRIYLNYSARNNAILVFIQPSQKPRESKSPRYQNVTFDPLSTHIFFLPGPKEKRGRRRLLPLDPIFLKQVVYTSDQVGVIASKQCCQMIMVEIRFFKN